MELTGGCIGAGPGGRSLAAAGSLEEWLGGKICSLGSCGEASREWISVGKKACHEAAPKCTAMSDVLQLRHQCVPAERGIHGVARIGDGI